MEIEKGIKKLNNKYINGKEMYISINSPKISIDQNVCIYMPVFILKLFLVLLYKHLNVDIIQSPGQ